MSSVGLAPPPVVVSGSTAPVPEDIGSCVGNSRSCSRNVPLKTLRSFSILSPLQIGPLFPNNSPSRLPEHFFELLKKIPKAKPVYLSTSLTVPSSTKPEASTFSNEFLQLKDRQLIESRIKSLRLEIGDLSIAENLEKLCDHYFKLRKSSRNDFEFDKKFSRLLLSAKTDSGDSSTEKVDIAISVTPADVQTKLLDANNMPQTFSPKISSPTLLLPQEDNNGGFGIVFHGLLSRRDTDKLLNGEGQYLIRKIANEPAFILSFRCNGLLHNFRLFRESRQYYLDDRKKGYATLDEMVNDGLTALFLESNVGQYVDALTEMATISKHDSMLSLWSPAPSEASWTGSLIFPLSPANSIGSRKNSTIGHIGMLRRPSEAQSQKFLQLKSKYNGQIESLKEEEDSGANAETTMGIQTMEDNDDDEGDLVRHCFLEGTIGLDKKAPCDIESCPLRKKKGKWYASPLQPGMKETVICKDCGLTLHAKCSEQLEEFPPLMECLPDLYKIPEIFGTDLTTLVKATLVVPQSPLSPGGCASRKDSVRGQPPFVVTKCVEEIERRGLDSEGIYRLSGSQDEMMQIQACLERDRECADLSTFKDFDSICGTLKLYFRQLPDPLIPRDTFKLFMDDFNENIPLTLESLKNNLQNLPVGHKITLQYFLAHLERVAQEKGRNKMTAYNLSSVLAPSLIIPEEMTLVTIKIATDVVEMLIKNNSMCNFFLLGTKKAEV